jgi:hypothetical protein
MVPSASPLASGGIFQRIFRFSFCRAKAGFICKFWRKVSISRVVVTTLVANHSQ